MSPLTIEIYRALRAHLLARTTSITYGQLAAAVSKKIPTHPRSSKLHAALGELTAACRARSLPCLPAMVWRTDTRRPSDGYYKLAHSRSRSELARVAAWEKEHARVVAAAARYPAVLA